MALHSQRRTRYRHSANRPGLLSTIGRILVAAGLSSGALVGVAVATQSAASAAGFGPDAFVNIDGSVRYVASTTPPPTNQFGWANSGATTPASSCTGSQVGVNGTNGLYDCGAPNPANSGSTTFVPLPAKYIGPAVGTDGVLAQSFITAPSPSDSVNCGNGTTQTGAFVMTGGTKFSTGLSQLGFGVKSAPAKDVLTDSYVVSRLNSAHQVEVFFGGQRTDNKGDSHVDFQFLQDKVGVTGSNACSGGFSGSREQGDILVDTNYVNGGGVTAPNVYTWTCPGTPTPVTGTKCDTTGSWNLQSPPVNVAIETSNSAPISCGGWVCEGPLGPSQIDMNEFVEGAINLGNLGFGVGCASSLFVETSSSQSGTSQLKAVSMPTNFSDCAPTTTTTTPSAKTIQLGQSLTDSVAVTAKTSAGPLTGNVTFYVCSNTATGCDPSVGTQLTGTVTSPNPATLDATGKATSPSYTPPSPGNYCFAGVFTPTSNPADPSFYAPSSDTSVDECFTVTALTPGFTTTPASSQITFGGSNTDTATVTGNSIGGVPTGSVTFYLCPVPSGASTCSGGNQVGTQSVNVQPGAAADTATATSIAVSPAPGNYCFNAKYNGAGNYATVLAETNGANECFNVAKQGTQSETHVTSGQVTFGSGGISDNVSVAPVSGTGPAPTGSVTFYVCETTTVFCPKASGTLVGTSGLNPPLSGSTSTATSPVFNPPSAGTWCFSAFYGGDSNYLPSQENATPNTTDTDECVTVGKAPTATTTTVNDAGSNVAWSGNETTGASAFDTAAVAPNPNFANAPTPTGTISYTFFHNGSCTTGTGSPAGTGLALGSPSSSEGSLPAGSYSFQATYSGDSNYAGSTGGCEPFTVQKGSSGIGTTVFDAGTKAPWSGTETTGAFAYDTASVTASSSIAPTGTVTYTFFNNGTCASGPAIGGSPAGTVGLTSPSNTEGPLAAGSYSFVASYSGDSNYNGSTGQCEPFSVAKGTSSVTTTVFDAATNAAWSGTESTGASAYDTSSVKLSSTLVQATGTVSYTFFTNGTCSGNGTPAAGGSIGSNSATEGPLGAGTYSFQAAYTGDSNFNGTTGSCEPFTVAQGTSSVSTTVIDASTGQPWSGSETTGASAFDTSSVTPSSDLVSPSGTVSYTLFSNGTCSGQGTGAGSGALGSNSTTTDPLAAGSYSFQATYSGDTNFAGSTGKCEPFTVGKGTSGTSTTVFDAATNSPWAGTELPGASAYDTSSVTASSEAFAPTGTVTYTFFSNATCNGNGSTAGGGPLGSNSNTEGPLARGGYSFKATYSGDSNYAGSTGPCESFAVGLGSSTTATTVFDAATNAAWSGTESTGASAYDTSVVTFNPSSSSAPAPTGTVSYRFFQNGGCTGDGVSASGGSLGTNSSTEGPLAAGTYSFEATYSGDQNYAGSTGPCEQFSVAKGTSSVSTTVFDASSNTPWTGDETGTPSAYDTSSVSASSDAFGPAGTVSYTFFPNGTCTPDTGTAAGTDLPLGTHSTTEGPLTQQGMYSFQATYSGDSNYAGSTGSCEPFVLEFPVITAAKSSTPAQGSIVHPGDTVTYTITLTNSGMKDATGVSLIDAIPAGTTYVPGSASDSGALTSNAISWSGLTVPGGGTKAVSFKVTVNSNDTDGQVIPNHAIFPNVNTPQSDCLQSSDTTPPQLQTNTIASVHFAAVSTATLCDTNTVTLTVAIPIVNVVKSEPTPGDGQTVTAGQTAPITYNLTVTNAGSADATNVVVTDVIPTGATYVTGSAAPTGEVAYNATTKTLTWTIPTVAAKNGSTPVELTFQVTVDAADANGSTLTNQAAFTDLHTPNCTAGTASGTCLTNTVSNPVVTPPVQITTTPQVTTTTAPPKHALAFTGLDARSLGVAAVSLVGIGTLMVLLGRRRRPEGN